MLLITLIEVAFKVYMTLMFIRIMLSWVRHNPYQPVIRFIYEITEPVLGFFRKLIPPIGPLDMSPIAAFFSLYILEGLIIAIIQKLLG